MSTFGKKALVWWDYNNQTKEALFRYNNSPKDIQLQILQKWYPIGSKCDGIYTRFTNPWKLSKYDSIIVSHEEHPNYWHVKIFRFDGPTYEKILHEKVLNYVQIKHPLMLYCESLEKTLIRDHKLNKLLK